VKIVIEVDTREREGEKKILLLMFLVLEYFTFN